MTFDPSLYSGLEVFEVQFATTALEASASVEVGAVLSTADLTTISVDEITTAFATGGIQTVQNEAFVAIDTSSSVVVQAESMFVSTHTQIIQESEVNEVEIAFAAAFRATMETSLESEFLFNCFHVKWVHKNIGQYYIQV